MAELREKIYRATVDYDREHDLARPGEHDRIQSLTDRILALYAEDRRELVEALYNSALNVWHQCCRDGWLNQPGKAGPIADLESALMRYKDAALAKGGKR